MEHTKLRMMALLMQELREVQVEFYQRGNKSKTHACKELERRVDQIVKNILDIPVQRKLCEVQ